MPFDAEVKVENRTKIHLQKARDRVAKGWCQWSLNNQYGGVCALGAIIGATGGTNMDYWMVRQALLPIIPDGFGIAYWNDRPERTQADVLALFDKAIAAL